MTGQCYQCAAGEHHECYGTSCTCCGPRNTAHQQAVNELEVLIRESLRQSELCTGKMSGVYAAVENVAAVIDTGDPSGLVDALTEAAEQVREVAQEYEDNRSNMPEGLQEGPTGTDMQEKADALNEFADSLENAANDDEICNWEADDAWWQAREDRHQAALDAAQSVIDELSI